MKKTVSFIIILAIAGCAFSALLLIQHYAPQEGTGILACNKGCLEVSLSSYSTIFGFPLAALGLLYFMWLTFTLLVADYAGETYLEAVMPFILFFSVLALIFDLVLAGFLFHIGAVCPYCLATYGINILICIFSYVAYRRYGEGKKLKERTSILFSLEKDANRAASASYVIMVFFLAFSIISMDYALHSKNRSRNFPPEEIEAFTEEFFSQPGTDISLPESPLVLGNPEAATALYVFTDFLCSACYQFYTQEKFLLAKFKGKLKIVYYHFPLEGNCTDYDKKAGPGRSCTAAMAVTAAAKLGIFAPYVKEHFRNYEAFMDEYNYTSAENIFNTVMSDKAHSRTAKFREEMERSKELIAKHLKAANILKINATPTLFIAGRRMEGAPPREMLNSIIKKAIKLQDGE